eukprot:350933-Chlamydomonas_euryale.AAC.6
MSAGGKRAQRRVQTAGQTASEAVAVGEGPGRHAARWACVRGRGGGRGDVGAEGWACVRGRGGGRGDVGAEGRGVQQLRMRMRVFKGAALKQHIAPVLLGPAPALAHLLRLLRKVGAVLGQRRHLVGARRLRGADAGADGLLRFTHHADDLQHGVGGGRGSAERRWGGAICAGEGGEGGGGIAGCSLGRERMHRAKQCVHAEACHFTPANACTHAGMLHRGCASHGREHRSYLSATVACRGFQLYAFDRCRVQEQGAGATTHPSTSRAKGEAVS